MSRGAAVRLQALPDELAGTESPLWWAVVLFLVIVGVVYATLASSYLYLRFHSPEWPPAGVGPTEPLVGLAGIVVLLASGAAAGWGARAARHGSPLTAKLGFGSGAVLALAFLGVSGAELYLGGFRWDDHAYGSVVWTIHLVHALHVLTLALAGLLLARLVSRGEVHPHRHLGADVLVLTWYVVVAAWIPMVAMLHLVPRWS